MATQLAGALLITAIGYHYLKPASKSLATQNKTQQRPGGVPQALPRNMWVDRAVNTALRNDAQGRTPHGIDAYLKNTYAAEAAQHPGVRLVAASMAG